MLRFALHYGIHLILPLAIAFFFFKENRWLIALVLLSGILIDVDHLLASPVFDPTRCSIGFHPLHSYWAIVIYLALFIFKKSRIFGLPFLIHMLADAVDCLLM